MEQKDNTDEIKTTPQPIYQTSEHEHNNETTNTQRELIQQSLNGLRMQISCLRISLEKEKKKSSILAQQLAIRNSTSSQQQEEAPSEVSDSDIETCAKVLKYLKSNKPETNSPRFKEIGDLAKSSYSFAIIQNYIHYKKGAKEEKKEPLQSHVKKSIDSQLMNTSAIRKQNYKVMYRIFPKIEDLREEDEKYEPGDELEEERGGEKIIVDEEASKSGSVTLLSGVNCYVCKKKFKVLHFFYDKLCMACAEKCYEKRMQTANLQGKVAIVTGGRIKVGYETTLKLLRNGATVLITTRFPRHACMCYSHEEDFEKWRHRLKIYGPLDFCDSKSIETFVDYVKTTYPEVHILVNNATQTITRPPEYYQSLQRFESAPISEAAKQLCIYPGGGNELVATVGDDSSYWEGEIIDTRPQHSWTSTISDVPTQEVEEVQKVNVVAPFILVGKLKSHMAQSTGLKFVINVTAMQGKFYRAWKTPNHPHTNMSKAALNMLTRTCHFEFAEKNIFMNSVDPGWLANDNPLAKAVKMDQRTHFRPPLDAIESAARVCDPIFSAVLGQDPIHGRFLKDYSYSLW